MVDEVCPPVGETETQNDGGQTIRGIIDWYRMQGVVSLQSVQILSAEQLNSYILLFNWWTAAFQHPSVTGMNLELFILKSPLLSHELSIITSDKLLQEWRTLDPEHSVLWTCIYDHFEMLFPEGITVKMDFDILGDAYNSAMRQLFTAEFINPNAESEQARAQLEALRRDAAIQSYCRQASIASLQSVIPGLLTTTVKLLDSNKKIFTVEASMPEFPRGFSRGPLIHSCPWLPMPAMHRYEDSEDEDDELFESEDEEDKEEGVRSESEGEEEKERKSGFDRLGGWPEYLWDLENSRTVRTTELGYPRRSYTAISHTWGRTILPGQNYKVPGGFQYGIPLNSAFNVTALPSSLKALQGKISSSYIWIDLLCIPQGDDEELREKDQLLRMREIGRQRQIFENAVSSIAWLHDVEDLFCLAQVFQWLCISIFDDKLEPEDVESRDQLKTKILQNIKGQRTGLVKRWKVKPEDELAVQLGNDEWVTPSSSWFNSLWTVQELCLRPDTWLATSKLDIMSHSKDQPIPGNEMSQEKDQPIPLNGLICVYHQFMSGENLKESSTDIEDIMRDISDWLKCTRLKELLLVPTRIKVLEIGSKRYCKDGKAEAIMSALGATSWYTDALSGEGINLRDLRTNGYHPSFVQEVRNLIPEENIWTLGAGTSDDSTEEYGMKMTFGPNNGESFSICFQSTKRLLDRIFS